MKLQQNNIDAWMAENVGKCFVDDLQQSGRVFRCAGIFREGRDIYWVVMQAVVSQPATWLSLARLKEYAQRRIDSLLMLGDNPPLHRYNLETPSHFFHNYRQVEDVKQLVADAVWINRNDESFCSGKGYQCAVNKIKGRRSGWSASVRFDEPRASSDGIAYDATSSILGNLQDAQQWCFAQVVGDEETAAKLVAEARAKAV